MKLRWRAETPVSSASSSCDWGEGRPVVFVHAWALNSEMWAYQIPDFVAAGVRCVTYD